jgi:carbon storage regulator CsrA
MLVGRMDPLYQMGMEARFVSILEGTLVMLVLARKKSETITLTCEDGTEIVVMLVENRGANSRIGISAPRSVKIMRTELVERGLQVAQEAQS